MRTHQTKPNQWSCSITAAAMAINIPVDQLIDQLGHDGSEIVFPHLPEPACRRGFHSQEIIHLAWRLGCTVTPMELFPMIAPSEGVGAVHVFFDGDQVDNWQRFLNIINNTEGVLEGAGKACRHAVYYDHGLIYDPDLNGGPIYGFSKVACTARGFYPQRALVFKDK